MPPGADMMKYGTFFSNMFGVIVDLHKFKHHFVHPCKTSFEQCPSQQIMATLCAQTQESRVSM